MVQIYGGLAADKLLFNSAFDRDSYLQGVGQLLEQMPDAVPAGVVAAGHLPLNGYRAVLGLASIAVSTARHEF